MAAPRKIDYAEARRLRKRGLTLQEIADRYGVTASAVGFVVDSRARAKAAAANALWQMEGTCIDCGRRGICRRYKRCVECAAIARTTTVRPAHLRCRRCKEWKPDSEFPSNRAKSAEHRRARHEHCRACNTINKREWRQRIAKPCPNCGAPTCPDGRGEKRNPRWTNTGLCRPCWLKSKRKAAA